MFTSSCCFSRVIQHFCYNQVMSFNQTIANLLPPVFNKWFIFSSDQHSYGTSNSAQGNLIKLFYKTNRYGKYIFNNHHAHKYQTQHFVHFKKTPPPPQKKKKKLWITYGYLNFRHWNFWHKRKPWLCKYLQHHHPHPHHHHFTLHHHFYPDNSYFLKITVFIIINSCQVPM